MTRALLACLLAAHLLAADQTFKAIVDAVRVDALVVRDRQPVVGLQASDFELLDNGVVQEIDSIGLGDVPVSILVVLDTSQSVAGNTLEKLKEAAAAALGTLEPGDRAALVTFSNEVRLRAAWSENVAGARQALGAVVAGGGTSLFDATFASLELRDDAPGHRRLLLLFSDGDDTASWLPESAAIKKAERTDVVVYSVVLGGAPWRPATLMYRSGIRLFDTPEPSWQGDSFARELAEATGGQMFTAGSTGDLREAFVRIVNEFRTRYLLTYTPRGVDTRGWHQISVRVKGGGTVTARRGYFR
jgi:Ca-activated chloride channel family protein